MPAFHQIINEIKKTINKPVTQLAEDLKDPSGHEYGFRHSNEAFMLIRDDKVIEHNAGEGAAIIIDGPGQTVSLKATGVVIDGQTVQIKVPNGGIYFGYQALNPFWLTDDPLDFASPLYKAPLYALPPAGPAILDTLFVARTATLPVTLTSPETGIATGLFPLAGLLSAEPLFGLNEQLLTLSRNVGHLIKSITEMGI